MESIKTQLYKLPDNMVYPGHGPETNIGYENNTIHSVGVGLIKFCKK